ncbi:hypothetical protein FZEAL_3922 [Fusarium zealandicum]|uniref:Thioredoxin domain-containing protein n=1 Tax=Fusarium zealandicum TaxID=1053134 RepID=A0A8H4XLA5_9HYPO|nr:hypothetical protein FZEAL_3922 [Fusarium zealandicum]
MSGPISIGSTAEWQSLLSSTNVVIADFYADWCGPCKMIAPTFESLAKEHSRPNKVAFAKINVDTQSAIARSNSVSAMPTFKIFHSGNCVETIKGANPPALTQAITNAVKLGDSNKPGDAFKTPGRTLGGDAAHAAPVARRFNLGGLLNALVALVGLYVFDAYKAAENSSFNIHRKPSTKGPNGAKTGAGGARPPQRTAFKTLADLGGD